MMLTEAEIRQALHASRVVPLQVVNPHGPLGLEHLAAALDNLRQSTPADRQEIRIRRPIELPLMTWERLHHLASAASQTSATPVSPGDLVAAIVEQYVASVENGAKEDLIE
jgi:hypothetical protein